MASEQGDRCQYVRDGGPSRQASGGQFSQDLDLHVIHHVTYTCMIGISFETPKKQDFPRYRHQDRECVLQRCKAFELPAFESAAGLQCLEEFIDKPTRTVVVDNL